MNAFLLVVLWLLNFGISWWNAYAAGKVWAEAKVAGGWPRFMTWMAAVMSACGFSWCILIFLVLSGHSLAPELVTDQVATVSLQLGYVLLVPFVLMSGYAITFDSWARAWRTRSLPDMGIAAWNTFASIHNTYSAIQNFGDALGGVADFFGSASGSRRSSSSKNEANAAAAILVIVLVALALAGGALLTTAIIRRAAGSVPLPSYAELQRERRLAPT